jgi:hypothetical protein
MAKKAFLVFAAVRVNSPKKHNTIMIAYFVANCKEKRRKYGGCAKKSRPS